MANPLASLSISTGFFGQTAISTTGATVNFMCLNVILGYP